MSYKTKTWDLQQIQFVFFFCLFPRLFILHEKSLNSDWPKDSEYYQKYHGKKNKYDKKNNMIQPLGNRRHK